MSRLSGMTDANQNQKYNPASYERRRGGKRFGVQAVAEWVVIQFFTGMLRGNISRYFTA